MTDIYFTWFGPPQPANKTVTGIPKLIRPDVAAIKLAASAQYEGDGPPPRFKFCCMKKHAAAFRDDLPDYIDIVPIEDQFDSSAYHSLSMRQADLNNLGMTVDFILRETLSFRGNRGLLVSRLAFLKDLWSLYCIWHFGGYHVDTGCFAIIGRNMKFPAPTTFGALANTRPANGATFEHVTVRFPSGNVCSTVSIGTHVLLNVVLDGLTTPRGESKLNRNAEVWLLRSTTGHKAAKLALEFYLQGWFVMRSKNLSDILEAQALRELIVSAVATGITHSGLGQGCSGMTLYKTHLIDMIAVDGTAPDLNIRKVGFQSHVV